VENTCIKIGNAFNLKNSALAYKEIRKLTSKKSAPKKMTTRTDGSLVKTNLKRAMCFYNYMATAQENPKQGGETHPPPCLRS